MSPVNQNGSFAFDRVIKRGKVDRRIKKKGAWKASWKPAYLVLRPNLLSVYKDHDETELRASITLSDVTAVAPVKKSHHDHVFGIFSPSKNYHFAGLSANETVEWLTSIRLESRTEELEELQPPNTSFTQADNTGYESTDVSVDEDVDVPGSPEVHQWTVRGNKLRATTQSRGDANRLSVAAYPGSEQFTTSQSDFSDALSPPVTGPKSFMSSSMPAQPVLSPIPDDTPIATSPGPDQSLVTIPDVAVAAQHQAQPIPIKHTSQPSDPSRVIRQGHLRFSKTISGVRQWKSVWVVLRATSLNIYKSNSETSPIHVMPMYGIIEAAEIDRKKKQNCFQVICEEKTHRFQADTENDLENWLGAFKSVLVRQEVERSSRHTSLSLGQGVSLPQVLPQMSQSQGIPSSGARTGQLPSRDGERSVTIGVTGGQISQLAGNMQGLGVKEDGGQATDTGTRRTTSPANIHAAVTYPNR